ncbi:unnamed protein product [Prorocentrum cordatum]|uniref:Uncharacterized protein n=1 Tax=Prorocentrum cordatum TaxID=2364126 RepID=A0ABN9VH24_9DINO|nr:unnamed protein product [Polarella glacialis]
MPSLTGHSSSPKLVWGGSLRKGQGPRAGSFSPALLLEVHRLCQGSAPERLDGATVLGCDMRAALVQLPDGRAGDTLLGRLRIWEPSGSSREQALGGYLRSSVAVVVVARAGDPAAGREARELLRRVRGAMRPGTALALAASQADLVSPRDSAGAAAVAGLRAAAGAAGADFALCSAVTGEGVEGLFAAALAACRERGALAACRGRPVLSCEAGQLSNSELLRALLLHRRISEGDAGGQDRAVPDSPAAPRGMSAALRCACWALSAAALAGPAAAGPSARLPLLAAGRAPAGNRSEARAPGPAAAPAEGAALAALLRDAEEEAEAMGGPRLQTGARLVSKQAAAAPEDEEAAEIAALEASLLDAKLPVYAQRPPRAAAAASRAPAREGEAVAALEATLLDAKLPVYLVHAAMPVLAV